MSTFFMSFFNFFYRKRKISTESIAETNQNCFPKGEADMIAGTNEVILILEGKISRAEARDIFIKCVNMSCEPLKLDRDRLVANLEDSSVHYFDNAQTDKFLSYLTALTVARNIFDCSPIDVERDGDGYIW